MDTLELEVSLNEKQYYHYNLYHFYHSFSGVFSIILGLLSIVVGVLGIMNPGMYTTPRIVLFFGFGILILVYSPISLSMRCKQRYLSNELIKKPLTYIFSAEGITLKQGEIEETMKWELIYKIVKTKESMVFYLSKVKANVLPLSEMGDKYDEICGFITKYADKRAIKFKL